MMPRSNMSFDQVTKWVWDQWINWNVLYQLGKLSPRVLCMVTSNYGQEIYHTIEKMTTWQNHWVVLTYSSRSSCVSLINRSVRDLVLSKSLLAGIAAEQVGLHWTSRSSNPSTKKRSYRWIQVTQNVTQNIRWIRNN